MSALNILDLITKFIVSDAAVDSGIALSGPEVYRLS